MKRVVIVHGWDGNPNNCWFPWLVKKLKTSGKDVELIVPEMPNSEEPEIDSWTGHLNKVVGDVDEDTYFVGHSIGCQTIMRYLEKYCEGKKIGGIVFVAPFFKLPNLETDEEKEIAKPWLTTKINTDKIMEMAGNIVCIFSDDDPDVPLSDNDLFQERLNAKVIIEKGKGHFSDDAGIKELPIVYEELLKMIN